MSRIRTFFACLGPPCSNFFENRNAQYVQLTSEIQKFEFWCFSFWFGCQIVRISDVRLVNLAVFGSFGYNKLDRFKCNFFLYIKPFSLVQPKKLKNRAARMPEIQKFDNRTQKRSVSQTERSISDIHCTYSTSGVNSIKSFWSKLHQNS